MTRADALLHAHVAMRTDIGESLTWWLRALTHGWFDQILGHQGQAEESAEVAIELYAAWLEQLEKERRTRVRKARAS